MATAHVLLLEIPQLLRDILEHAIAAHEDFELLNDEPDNGSSTPPPQVPPDVVILGITDPRDTSLLPGLFARWPQARVMTLMPAGDRATVWELRLGQAALEVVSPAEILRALRRSTPERAAQPGSEPAAIDPAFRAPVPSSNKE